MNLSTFLGKSELWHLKNARYQQVIDRTLVCYRSNMTHWTINLAPTDSYRPTAPLNGLMKYLEAYTEQLKNLGIARVSLVSGKVYHINGLVELSPGICDILYTIFRVKEFFVTPDQVQETLYSLSRFEVSRDTLLRTRWGLMIISKIHNDRRIWVCPKLGVLRQMYHNNMGNLP